MHSSESAFVGLLDAPSVNFSQCRDGDAFRASLSVIDPFPSGNIRKKRDPEAFLNLRTAIRNANGVTQGVTVRINPDDSSRLQLLAGYGRFEASQLEGFEDIPVVFKVADDKEADAIMLSENLDREDLSIADEIIAAQRYVSHYDGDYESAAKMLNWSVNRLKGRLALNNCGDKVLDALRDKLILVGHAEVLCVFTESLQDSTLVKIIDEGWSVEYLKERAGKANRYIKHAIFDTTECNGCAHNSDIQTALFENTLGRAKCNNLNCYRDKTNAALDAKKTQLEEEYGVVLLAIEKPVSDRNTVAPCEVGLEQYKTGCTGCANNVAILQDGINKNAGGVCIDQCIDTDCFRKMKQANTEAESAAITDDKESKSPTSKSTGKGGVKGNTKSAAKKPVEQKISSSVAENNRKTLNAASIRHFSSNMKFREAVSLAAMIGDLGSIHGREALAKYKLDSLLDIKDRALAIYAMERKDYVELLQEIYLFTLKKEVDLSIAALAEDEQGQTIAVRAWEATDNILKAYTKKALKLMGTESGFDNYYDTKYGENAFNKLMGMSKGDVIKGLSESGFDWASYAPKDYLKFVE